MTITSLQEVVPGRPEELGRAGRQLKVLADGLEDAHGGLRRLVTDVGSGRVVLEGRCASAFDDEFEDLPTSVLEVSLAARAVGGALTSWSRDLSALQGEARRALDRWRAEKRRRDADQQALGRASQRLGDLARQIGEARGRASGHLTQHRAEALRGQTAEAGRQYQLYVGEFRIAQSLEGEKAGVEREQQTLRGRIDQAESGMRAAQHSLHRLRDQHADHDRSTAHAIDGALPATLRNQSFLEKADRFLLDLVAKLEEFVSDFSEAALDAIEAGLSGDWSRAVFRLRELIDLVTPILSMAITALSVLAIFIPVPGLNLLIAGALVLAVARFASTGFLLASDADDPDHPGTKAATFGELVQDGAVVAAALVAVRHPPQVGPGSWSEKAGKFLRGEPAKGVMKVLPQSARPTMATLMSGHPGATTFAQKVVWEKAVKPRVDAFVMDETAAVGERVTGVDRDTIGAGITVGRSAAAFSDGLGQGDDWAESLDRGMGLAADVDNLLVQVDRPAVDPATRLVCTP